MIPAPGRNLGVARPVGAASIPLRSLLFIPINVDRYVDKAHLRGADGLVLDLEDSIAGSEKAAARRRVGAVAETLKRRGVAKLFVRINRPLRLALNDLESSVLPEVSGIFLPKAQSADHVRLISEAIAELEIERGIDPGSILMCVRVETADAFFKMEEIASADPRIGAFGLGGEDFSLSIGVEPEIDTLIYPKQRSIIAARAAGVTPLGLVASGADFTDREKMRVIVQQSRRFGFEGSTCIHPAVVPLLNEGFRPGAAEVELAERMLAAFSAGIAGGSASINFEGKMVDYPVAFRAERLLAKHRMIVELERRNAEIR